MEVQALLARWPMLGGTRKVREISVYCTCWWYSLCNLKYWSNYTNTCSYNLGCWIYTSNFFHIFLVCLTDMTNTIKCSLFSMFDFISCGSTGQRFTTSTMAATGKGTCACDSCVLLYLFFTNCPVLNVEKWILDCWSADGNIFYFFLALYFFFLFKNIF